ncbi:hypothetical protein Y032_0036g3271 [Ancylostoma ceylanicum]|nr:hypothetical protein Y032_0036g3271 [Ancylostoma ceylanicum]
MIIIYDKEKYSGTGGGPGLHVAKLSPYLNPLVDLLGEKHLEHSVPVIEDAPPFEQNLDLSGDTSDNERITFDIERKPTRKELQTMLAEKSTEDAHACSEDAASPEVLVVSEKRTAREKGRTEASAARETLSLFKGKRSILWEEETKLARMKQQQHTQMEMEEIAARLKEAKLGVELKKVQLEQALLELERLRGAPAAPTPAPTPPVSYPYPTYFNMTEVFTLPSLRVKTPHLFDNLSKINKAGSGTDATSTGDYKSVEVST